MGVIAPVSRGASSGHRVYDEGDTARIEQISRSALELADELRAVTHD